MMILTLMMARMKILNFDDDYDDDDDEDDDCSITFSSCRFLFAFIVNQYHCVFRFFCNNFFLQ